MFFLKSLTGIDRRPIVHQDDARLHPVGYKGAHADKTPIPSLSDGGAAVVRWKQDVCVHHSR